MSNFRPVRASPLLKPGALDRDSNPLHDSRSSSVSVPELIGLTPQEIEFIDTVVERAPPTATTFLTVLKVYNDLLQERGIDPHNEVVYFGKLLKLGTVKGKTWKEKWSIVKNHHGYKQYQPRFPIPTRAVTRPGSASPPKFIPRFRPPDPEADTFTLDSHTENTEFAHTESEIDDPQYHGTPRPIYLRSQSATRSTATSSNSLGLEFGAPASYPSAPTFPQQYRHRFQAHQWDTQDSDSTDFAPTQISTPPSYGAALRDSRSETVLIPSTYANFRARRVLERPLQAEKHDKMSIPEANNRLKERRGSVIDEDDAWNKVKMLRDETDADKFREEKLVDRCWDVWRQGCEWIKITNVQIAEARDLLALRVAWQRWRARTASRSEFLSRVDNLSNGRCLKAAFNMWKVKLQAKRQAQWRDDMRYKMKVVRTNREEKLKKDAWAKWRQSYQSHLSGQHYTERLVLRFFEQWKRKLMEIDHMEAAADELAHIQEERRLVGSWKVWKKYAELRTIERLMAERVDLRVMSEVVHTWKRQMRDVATADAFYDKMIMRRALCRWRVARERILARAHRASKHLARQDDVLIRAVMRVWKAHERGKLLVRVGMVRLLRQTWSVWQRRLRQQKDRERLALAFSMRPSSTIVLSSLQVWCRVYTTHQNAAAFAVHYHSAQLSFKMMLAWRIRLRERLKMVKQARIAERFLVLRRMWKRWKDQLEDAKRVKKVKIWDRAKLKAAFEHWHRLVQHQKQLRWSEQMMKQRVAFRIMAAMLTHWTNRVADIKFRELETLQGYEIRITARVFKKWKAVCIRHVEELSLMQSYQDVKREENMRKMFYKWLNSARTARHRRVTLQQREDDMKHKRLAVMWEKWREMFQDIQLQPLADGFIVQRQRNLMFFAFGLWHSKTRSLPALRFHASHAKEKFWNVWRNAMPRALQSKQARDMDRNSVLARALDRWLTKYRTKMALKAIARARYLRLPTTAPRQTAKQSRVEPMSVPPLASKTSATPRRAIRSPSPDDDNVLEPRLSKASNPFAGRSGIASLLTSRSASPENRMSRPKFSSRGSTREPSPTRSRLSFGLTGRSSSPPKPLSRPSSSAAGDRGRSRIWQEMREVQRRSRPPTERSPSPS